MVACPRSAAAWQGAFCTALLASAVAYLVAYLYRLHAIYLDLLAAADYDVALGSHGEWRATWLARQRLPRPSLQSALLEDFNRRGFVVVRRALPRSVVEELFRTICAAFPPRPRHFRDEQGTWWLNAYNSWMDVDALADLVMHPDLLLGSLAAQLLNASTIRMAAEALKGISPLDRGHKVHMDLVGWHMENVFLHRPSDLPLVRLFLPLASEDLNSSTGGSLRLLPLDDLARFPQGLCPREGFQMPSGACLARVRSGLVAPELQPGDALLYSPNVFHQTEPLRRGRRVSYVANLYDPARMLQRWRYQICNEGLARCDGTRPLAFDVWGLEAECFDAWQGEYHFHFYWQSAFTRGFSSGGSVCAPQVYPRLLPQEVEARRQGLVHNHRGRHRFRRRLGRHSPGLVGLWLRLSAAAAAAA